MVNLIQRTDVIFITTTVLLQLRTFWRPLSMQIIQTYTHTVYLPSDGAATWRRRRDCLYWTDFMRSSQPVVVNCVLRTANLSIITRQEVTDFTRRRNFSNNSTKTLSADRSIIRALRHDPWCGLNIRFHCFRLSRPFAVSAIRDRLAGSVRKLQHHNDVKMRFFSVLTYSTTFSSTRPTSTLSWRRRR